MNHPLGTIRADPLVEFESAFGLYKQQPEMQVFVKEVTGEDVPSILPKIMKNPKLFRIFARANCRKFRDILRALNALTDDDILVHIVEIGMYGLFAPNHYVDFVGNVRDNRDKENPIPLTTRQIVLCSSRQKLVFMLAGDECDKLREYIQSCFSKESVSIVTKDTSSEITLNCSYYTGDECRLAYRKLFGYINSRDPAFAEKLSMLRSYSEESHDYTIPTLDNNRIYRLPELIAAIKTWHPECSTLNINITNFGTIGNNNTITGSAPDKYMVAERWIKVNPPKSREFTRDYYARYQKAVTDPVDVSRFGPLVTDAGHRDCKGHRGRYWV